MKTIKIAIDGYAGTGKSTTARRVARKLNYTYIDTGAMYRAVTLFFLREGVPFDEVNPHMLDALNRIQLSFVESADHHICMFLNGENVEDEIRKPEVSSKVSQVAVHGPVREKLVKEQRSMGAKGGVVMDGRDIGTVVFPDAELKIFMKADMEVRARRRKAELEAKGSVQSLEEITENLLERDKIDANREIAPLKKADDAKVIDTSTLNFAEQVDMICQMADQKLKQLSD